MGVKPRLALVGRKKLIGWVLGMGLFVSKLPRTVLRARTPSLKSLSRRFALNSGILVFSNETASFHRKDYFQLPALH